MNSNCKDGARTCDVPYNTDPAQRSNKLMQIHLRQILKPLYTGIKNKVIRGIRFTHTLLTKSVSAISCDVYKAKYQQKPLGTPIPSSERPFVIVLTTKQNK